MCRGRRGREGDRRGRRWEEERGGGEDRCTSLLTIVLSREQQNELAKEDLSDMVAEHAAKQRNKRKRQDAKEDPKQKKYKEFKF